MSDPRYAYDNEEGFFVDMGQPYPDDPSLGTELLTSEVVGLLNESDTLWAVVGQAQIGIDDIRDALQNQEYSEEITIITALDLCQEITSGLLAALPEHLKKLSPKERAKAEWSGHSFVPNDLEAQ